MKPFRVLWRLLTIPYRRWWIPKRAAGIITLLSKHPIRKEDLFSTSYREFSKKTTIDVLAHALAIDAISQQDIIDIDPGLWLIQSCSHHDRIQDASRQECDGAIDDENAHRDPIVIYLERIHAACLQRILDAHQDCSARNAWSSKEEALEAFRLLIVIDRSNRLPWRVFDQIKSLLYESFRRSFGTDCMKDMPQREQTYYDMLSGYHHEEKSFTPWDLQS